MAASRSLLSGRWSLSLSATVVNDIALEVFLFTAWSAAVCLISNYRVNLGISPQMLTVLGTVLGLVVSFRTTSAYDRYWEGRKLWSAVTLASRNLGHIIWIHVPVDRSDKATAENPLPKDAQLRAVLEKKSMINLVEAFSVAVKHYLRGEGGIFYEDLYPLVSFLPRHAPSSDEFQSEEDTLPLWHADQATTKQSHNTNGLKHTNSLPGPPQGLSARMHPDLERVAMDSEKARLRDRGVKLPPNVRLLPARSPPQASLYDYIPLLIPIKPVIHALRRLTNTRKEPNTKGRNWMGRKIKPGLSAESNVPLEICLFLSSYLAMLLKQGLLQPAIATAYVNNLSSFQDAVTALERVRTTPIPFAYQMHLRMTIWLYLLFLPFQIVLSLDWVTIPATAFAAFLYLGFLEIGSEIEDPFQYDANDLDLDHFCKTIARELSEVTAHPVVDPSTYIFSQWNQPLAPADTRSADEIVNQVDHHYHNEDTGLHSVRRTLLRGWRETNDILAAEAKTK